MPDDGPITAEMALYDALRRFQEACPPIVKNREARAGSYKYKYADYAKVIETIKKPLADAGLSFSQPLRTVDGRSKLITYVFHVGGGMIESDIDLALDKLEPQKVGILLSYYRRYLLTTTLGLASDDDDDAASAQRENVTLHQQAELTAPVGGTVPPDEMQACLDAIFASTTTSGVNAAVQAAFVVADKYNDTKAHTDLRAKGAAKWKALAAEGAK